MTITPTVCLRATNPRGSTLFRGEGGLRVKSNWSRHSLEGELRGGYSEYFDYPNREPRRRPGRHDRALRSDDRHRARSARTPAARYAAARRAGDLRRSVERLCRQPADHTRGRNAGRRSRRNSRGSRCRCAAPMIRVWYQDAQYSNGTTLNLASTSYKRLRRAAASLLRGYAGSEAFRGRTLDKRIHDSPVDPYGFYRDSTGYTIRGGATFNVTEMVERRDFRRLWPKKLRRLPSWRSCAAR